MASPQAYSSSSEDDFYDNFEKYKQKHKSAASNHRIVIKKECSKENVRKVEPTVRKPELAHVKVNDVSDVSSCEILQAVDKTPVDDLEAEFFEFANSKSSSSLAKTRNEAVKWTSEGQNLKNLLQETQLTLGILQNTELVESQSKNILCQDSAPVNLKRRCTLNLRNLTTGQSFIDRCDMEEPFQKVMIKCSERLAMNAENIVFMGRDRRFYSDDTPLSVGLDEENVNDIEIFHNSDAKSCMISIKWLLKGRKPIKSEIFMKKKFSEFKKEFCQSHNLDFAKTEFIFDSEKLNDDDTPESLELENDDCIDVYVKE